VAGALIDLGSACLRANDPAAAAGHLEEALAIVQELGDRSRESDVLGNLGLAVLGLKQPARALELFNRELASARQAGDRFAGKIALTHLGNSYAAMRNPGQAMALFEQALALAREVGDRPDEAELLWRIAIQYAELGQRDEALAWAQASVDLFRALGMPQGDYLADHLQKYRSEPAALFGGPIVAGGWAQPAPAQAATGPGLLRMALSGAKAIARFVGSGFKTVPAPTHRQRLATCASCEHHTGLRCRVCGCFTNAKAWLPHERCPIGKWPA
jgi:tetratricopeptide (TPR) repeat protein